MDLADDVVTSQFCVGSFVYECTALEPMDLQYYLFYMINCTVHQFQELVHTHDRQSTVIFSKSLFSPSHVNAE